MNREVGKSKVIDSSRGEWNWQTKGRGKARAFIDVDLYISVDQTVCFDAWELDRLPLFPVGGGVVDQAHRCGRRDRSRTDTVLEKGETKELMIIFKS